MNGRIIKRNINETGGFIPLGRAGENKFRAIGIDVLGWADEDAECRIIYSRPDGLTYPVEITCKFSFLIWTPSAYDTEIPGEGEIEVRTYCGDAIGKSATFKVRVEQSMQAVETESGIARPDWVDDIIDKVTISGMEQTEASTESGGVNIFTVTLTNGESASFEVRNGAKGEKGNTGAKGEKGDKGDTGETGPQGERGDKGDKGEQGEQGERGKDGADGYTPRLGIDYWTEKDKAEIKAYVDAQLGDIETALDSIIALQNKFIGG